MVPYPAPAAAGPGRRRHGWGLAVRNDYGYYFHAPLDGRSPGHPVLEINLFDVPTERHFDPEHLTFPVASPDGNLGTATLSHPWHGPETLRACIGPITLLDRRRKSVRAYSFGSTVRARADSDRTHCVVNSEAPILEMVPSHHLDPDGIVTWLAAEVEALLARRRAAWRHDEAEFARRLAGSDPLELYVAALTAVRAGIARRRPVRRTDRDRYAALMIDRALELVGERRGAAAPVPAFDALI